MVHRTNLARPGQPPKRTGPSGGANAVQMKKNRPLSMAVGGGGLFDRGMMSDDRGM